MRGMSTSFLILMVLFSFAPAETDLGFGQIWSKVSDTPLINTVGDSGAWNGSTDAWNWNWGHVLEDADTFKLYIGGSDGTNYSIGMWYSTDIDSGWVEHPANPVLERSESGWDSEHVGGCTVIKDGDTYKMWYTGTAHFETHGGNKTIGYATSLDGVNWNKHPDPVIDPNLFIRNGSWVWVDNPYVIQDEDTLRMWFGVSCVNPTFEAIYYGYSLDGINWVFPSLEPVLSPLSEHWLAIPYVQKSEDGYRMWAMEGSYGNPYPANTIFTISSDERNWRRDRLYNPVLKKGETGGIDADGVGIYGVFETDDGYSALYAAWGNSDLTMYVGLAKYTPTNIPEGDVSGIWTKAGSPYRVEGEITVPDGETLEIEAGTTIQFLEHTSLQVQGQLLALGNADEPIRFWVDDTTDFTIMSGYTAFWRGIRFGSTPATNDSSIVSYCDIRYAKNFAGSGGGLWGVCGGAFYISNVDKLRIDHCVIKHNRAIGNFGDTDTYGAGLAILNSSPVIAYNLIENNVTRHLSHDTWAHGGGLMIGYNSSPLIIGNTIKQNRCSDVGGGVAIWGDNCNPMLINNLIVENSATSNTGLLGYGGGVGGGGDSHPTFINNTIARNRAGWGGGGLYLNGGDANLINTIIAENVWTHANTWETFGHEIATYGNSMAGYTINFNHSALMGGPTDIMWGVRNTGSHGQVNFIESLSIDPELTSTYGLNTARSQCFGAGTPSCVIDGVTYHAVPQDMNGHICPDPPGSMPDMGAIESILAGHRVTPSWNWYHWPLLPVMQGGPQGGPDDVSVIGPDVLFYNGQYHMWYGGYDGNRIRICHASSDDGIEWDRDPANPILTSDPTTWQGSSLNAPRVIIHDGVFHMWFSSNNRAGHATSTDGAEWTMTAGAVLEGTLGTWDEDLVGISDVIYKDSLFHAWYTGERDNVRAIGYATSEDGINWTKLAEPVFQPDDTGWDSGWMYATSVIYNGMYYYMWYSAKENDEPSRVGRAKSSDGIVWIPATDAAPEIDYGPAGSWYAASSFYAAALLHEGRYEIWFNGVPYQGAGFRVGRATLEPVGLEQDYIELPLSFMLSQNYPNPFNPLTHIRYALPENGDIRLLVYDLLGREVIELVNGYRNVGNYETTWSGLDKNGNQVNTGVYFARLEAGRKVDVIKMLYLK